MSKRRTKLLLATSLVSLLLVSACSSNNTGNSTNNGASDSGSNGTETNAAANGNTANETVDPFGKYDPPIDLTTVRSTLDGTKFPPGDSWDNNTWSRAYEEMLGIKIKNNWNVSNAQFDQKMNVSIVSGDLPDLIPVNAKQLQTLVQGDMIEDMTDVFEKYASPMLKDTMNANNALPKKSASYDGKLMAIPGYVRGNDDVDMIWIREDWRIKLGLPEPKTIDDLVKIILAFTNDDPDGNGKKDTYGLNLNKTLWDGYSGLRGWFNGFHAYPYSNESTSMWIKDKDGKLVYGSIQPEMKPALAKLQELYKAGAIDPQFVVYDGPKSAENEKNEKTGVHFGHFWNIGWPIDPTDKQKNPNMEWKPYPIVSVDDQPAAVGVVQPQSTWFYAVKKGYKHPEALVKMLNLYYEKLYGATSEPSVYHTQIIDGENYGIFPFSPVDGQVPEKNLTAWRLLQDAFKSEDTSGLNPEQKQYYDAYMKYVKEKDVTNWGADRTWGPEGSYSIIAHYTDNNLMLTNEFIGAPTPTMAQKGSILMDMEKQMITKIILGESVDSFDTFVENWKASGGDQITAELNEWYAANNK
ncbi:extracellular solute-binding protein [Paenibacillus silvisoli]|uniref:extracellular solute-binding protein n=1 Tax=Paenibacillus silvisoli TaxID=3110539 RepID=UPI002805B64F|nr:extracellular solute-binding protein [Paenibacillus silvisoli]